MSAAMIACAFASETPALLTAVELALELPPRPTTGGQRRPDEKRQADRNPGPARPRPHRPRSLPYGAAQTAPCGAAQAAFADAEQRRRFIWSLPRWATHREGVSQDVRGDARRRPRRPRARSGRGQGVAGAQRGRQVDAAAAAVRAGRGGRGHDPARRGATGGTRTEGFRAASPDLSRTPPSIPTCQAVRTSSCLPSWTTTRRRRRRSTTRSRRSISPVAPATA